MKNQEMTAREAFLRLAALCAKGEHCQHEMLEKMGRWGLDDEAQASVMAQLTGGRYVDDERFARAFVGDKVRYNKWGPRKVEQALWAKHIDKDIRQRVLDEVPAADYAAVLRPLLRQKSKTLKAGSDYELRQKLVRFALARGFTFDIIKACMDTTGMDDESEYLD